MGNFVVETLPAYVQENKDLLLKNFALVGGGIRKRISVQTGVKGSAAINFMEIAPVVQDGSACGFTAQGDVTLTQRVIETKAYKVNLEICPKTLKGKYAEYLISMNASEAELPFEQYIMEGVTNSINKKIETTYWEEIAAVLADETTETATFAGTMYETIGNVYLAMADEAIERGAEIYVSPANFRKFLQELVAKNFYHYASATEAAPTEFYYPGSNVKVVMSPGVADNKVYGTFAKNLFYGCDMESDAEVIDLWWSKDDRVYKLAAEWNMGVQVAFPNMVVVASK